MRRMEPKQGERRTSDLVILVPRSLEGFAQGSKVLAVFGFVFFSPDHFSISISDIPTYFGGSPSPRSLFLSPLHISCLLSDY